MQIYEITSKRRVNENIVGALAGGLTKAIANQFVSSTLGIAPGSGGPDDPQARAQAAMQINQQLAAQLGQQMNKIWSNVLQNYQATAKDDLGNPLTSLSSETVPPADVAKLEQELSKMVMQMVKIKQPTLDQWVSSISTDDPALARNAKDIVEDIKFAIRQIMSHTLNPSDRGRLRATFFDTLAKDIARVQNFNTFTVQKQQQTSDGMQVKIDPITKKVTIDGNPYDDRNPQHKAAYDAFKAAGGGTP